MKIINPVKPILLSIVLLFNILDAYSQVSCGFDQQHRTLLKNNSFYRKTLAETEQKVKYLLADKDLMKIQAPVYTIPVVVHVIHNGEPEGTGTNISDAQIQSAINSLTQYYRGGIGMTVDAEIEFRLATLDPNCNPTTGINRVNGSGVTNYSTLGVTLNQSGGNEIAVKNLSKWTAHYYNIWVVSEIEGNNGGGGIQGFAYFPGAPETLDGTVVLASSFGYDPGGSLGYNLKGYTNLNTTLVHEMAHALGIYHTFEGDDPNNDGVVDSCPANTTCSTEGDMVCDTDPHTRSASNCPVGVNACNGDPLSDIVHNFMDYSSEACKTNFTPDQVTRMRYYLVAGRPELYTSHAANASSPVSPYVPPVAAVFSPATINLGPGSYAGIHNITLNNRYRNSSTAQIDGGYLNRVGSCLNLIQLFRGVSYTLDVRIMAYNHEQFGAWMDYNNDGDFLDTGEQLALTTHIAGTGVSGSNIIISVNFTVPSTAPLNTAVRLRVMDDISTAYGVPAIASNTNSEYGQAEDYPVYFSTLLPAVMHSFTGHLTDNHAQLQWTASIDQQTKGFDVERSYNGIDFKKVGYVSASSGQGGQPAKFIFSDGETALEDNYYRLKQWDVDNRFEYSNIVLIKSAKNAGAGFSVLNNPFNNYIDIVFNKPLKEKAVIRLLDIHGREVHSESIMASTDQKRRIDLSGKTLLKGVYILEVRLNDRQYAQKLIRY